jgi:glycosyltransferase involved in cell wall biosynthesis
VISIVTPVLNGAKTIQRTMESVSKTEAEVEHVIQDAGSSDGTEEVILRQHGSPVVRYYKEPDHGIYDGIVKGMAKARGQILGWLGSDDYYLPWTLSTVESIFDRNPNIDWIIGLPTFGFEGGRIVKVNPLAPVYIRRLVRLGYYRAGQLGFLQQEAMFWRRSLWDRAQAPSVILSHGLAGDYHLWRAFAEYSELHTVSTSLAVFSSSPSQASSRFRNRYLREAGCIGESMEPGQFGKLFNRVASIILNKRVIRPDLHIN